MTTHETNGESNGKYLSWGFLKKLGVVLGALGTVALMLISFYCWIDAKIESKMDRALMMEMMAVQTASFKDAMASQSAAFREAMAQQSSSLNKMAASQENMAEQIHSMDKRLVKIETKLENK